MKPGAAQQALNDLGWLGLDWDGEVTHQTQRLALYEKALEYLRSHEMIYTCTCSRADVERAASAPHAEDEEGPRYPGTCRGRDPGEVAARAATQGRAPVPRRSSRPRAMRWKSPTI